MRNKVTLDMMDPCGCDCKCIISESDGSNTLELYMESVGTNPIIHFQWTNPDGSGEGVNDTTGFFLDTGEFYYSANPEIFTGNRLLTMTMSWDDFTSREIYFQCVNLTADTNFTVTRDLSADDLYRVAAATDDTLPIATTTSTGVVQIGTGLNVDESGVISTPIASKETLGIVKIGDGIDVEQGTISLATATEETIGGVKPGENLNFYTDGTIEVPLATTDSPGVVQVGNGLKVDENGVLSVNQFGGNVILIDHTPTESDLTHTNAILVQYDKENEILSDGKSTLYSVTATFAEIVETIVLTPIIGFTFDESIENYGYGDCSITTSGTLEYATGVDNTGKCLHIVNGEVKISGVKEILDGDFTIVFKFKIDNLGGSRRFGYWYRNNSIMSQGILASGGVTTNRPCLNMGGGLMSVANAYADNNWHTYVLTKCDTHVALVIDSIDTVTDTTGFSSDISGDSLYIGDTTNPLYGYIDNWKMFNRVLTNEEINEVLRT